MVIRGKKTAIDKLKKLESQQRKLRVPAAEKKKSKSIKAKSVAPASQINKKKELQVKKAFAVAESFQEEYKKLKKLIGSEALDFTNERSSMMMLRAMLVSTLSLIPLAEQKYKTTKSSYDIHSYVALTSQAREISNDIRAVQDLEQQVNYINVSIIQPALKLITQNSINEIFELKKKINIYISSSSIRRSINNELNGILRIQSTYLMEISKMLEDQLRKYLL